MTGPPPATAPQTPDPHAAVRVAALLHLLVGGTAFVLGASAVVGVLRRDLSYFFFAGADLVLAGRM